MYLCELCEENFTEGGDCYCHLCRSEIDDTEKLDRAASHQASTRALRITQSDYFALIHTILNRRAA